MNKLSQFTKNGKFLMLAIDHRHSFKKILNPKEPERVSDELIIKTKQEIISSLSDQVSGVLLDVNWGLPAYKKTKINLPFLLAIEKSGYQEKDDGRLTTLAYSIDQLKKKGASGIKLLIYFNPFSSTASVQLKTARQIFLDCRTKELPFFLEIVTYHTDNSVKKNVNLIIESLKRFLAESIRPDVFKIEYPGSIKACKQVNDLLKHRPWILLTRGENFEVFRHQLKTAVDYGCQGFLAGRALWKEIGMYQNEEERKEFLNTVVKKRFQEIVSIVEKKAS